MQKKILIGVAVAIVLLVIGWITMGIIQKQHDKKVINNSYGVNVKRLSLHDKIELFTAYLHEGMQDEMIDMAITIATSSGLEDLEPKDKKKVITDVASVLDGIPGSDSGEQLRKRLA